MSRWQTSKENKFLKSKWKYFLNFSSFRRAMSIHHWLYWVEKNKNVFQLSFSLSLFVCYLSWDEEWVDERSCRHCARAKPRIPRNLEIDVILIDWCAFNLFVLGRCTYRQSCNIALFTCYNSILTLLFFTKKKKAVVQIYWCDLGALFARVHNTISIEYVFTLLFNL